MLSDDYQALWDVVRVALVCMMLTQIVGGIWDYFLPVNKTASYECDFQLADHVVTMPCEIRSVSYQTLE
jgi:hypothetical protein